jgi:hypothetical protein
MRLRGEAFGAKNAARGVLSGPAVGIESSGVFIQLRPDEGFASGTSLGVARRRLEGICVEMAISLAFTINYNTLTKLDKMSLNDIMALSWSY